MSAHRLVHASRGFSLLEAVGVIVILAIAVPASVALVNDAASARADGVMLSRGVALAGLVMESVRADVASGAPGLGFEALSDAPAYVASLEARLATLIEPYEQAGLEWSLEIGERESVEGGVTGDPDVDVIRPVHVRVLVPRTRGGQSEFLLEGLVAAP